jgi:hypothetical protein
MPDGPISAEASFAIPYNYDIVPELKLFPANAERIQIGGTELSFTSSFDIKPRFNGQVQETYATATRPGTRWQVMEFYLPPTTPNPNWADELTHIGLTLPCSFYSGSAFDCNIIAGASGTGQLNAGIGGVTSLLDMQRTSTFTSASMMPRMVKDLPIGTKFCVSAAVMDYSSHNGATGWVSGNGYTDTMRNEWKITKPECVSIGKAPMVNVIAGGLYSDGKIEGAIFEKTPSGQSDEGIFGSWGEYKVVSNNTTRSFASGAALGTGAGGVPLGGATTATLIHSGAFGNSSCKIAVMTFRNVGCSPSSLNTLLERMSGANTAHGLARNIRHRYTGRSEATAVSGNISLSGYSERMNYIHSSGSLTINASTIQQGRSVIVEAAGSVTIVGNITLSDGPYTDISQIPQVMIFAQNIYVDPSVTRVDAWLLAGLNGGNGTINTCRNISANSGVTNVDQLTGNICNNPLRINGPVMASRILLHRTAGAGIGMPESARPAEVFFLSPATYLWAYNQSANLRQAFLTYAREVAPRF